MLDERRRIQADQVRGQPELLRHLGRPLRQLAAGPVLRRARAQGLQGRAAVRLQRPHLLPRHGGGVAVVPMSVTRLASRLQKKFSLTHLMCCFLVLSFWLREF